MFHGYHYTPSGSKNSGKSPSDCPVSSGMSTTPGSCLTPGGTILDRCTSSGKFRSVAKLTEWRDRALAGAASALKERERDDREDEIARLKSKVGEITMDNELLFAKIAAMEAKSPLARRRSRR